MAANMSDLRAASAYLTLPLILVLNLNLNLSNTASLHLARLLPDIHHHPKQWFPIEFIQNSAVQFTNDYHPNARWLVSGGEAKPAAAAADDYYYDEHNSLFILIYL